MRHATRRLAGAVPPADTDPHAGEAPVPLADTPAPDPAEIEAEHLRGRLEAALAGADEVARRIGSAGTTVAFVVDGRADLAVTLLLDRRPPAMGEVGEPAEVTIEFDCAQARCFALGELPLPVQLQQGRVGWRGPVRKYLPKDPILRALLRRGVAGERPS